MSKHSILLRGGTVISGYGSTVSDIYIDQGKICWLGKQTLPINRGKPVEIMDASDYYILPGFISLQSLENVRSPGTTQLADYLSQLISSGVTCFEDTLWLEPWMENMQIDYQMTAYYNSPIDYTVRIGLDDQQFTYDRLHELIDKGFRLFSISLKDKQDLIRINWKKLRPLLEYTKLSLHLHIPEYATLNKTDREELCKLWQLHCQTENIRTSLFGPDPFQNPDQYPTHTVIQLDHATMDKAVTYLSANWYSYLSVICPIHQWHRLAYFDRPHRLLSLLVRLASTNIAKLLGCYPRKGSLTPGADADLIMVQKTEWLTNFDHSSIVKTSEICLPTYVMSKGKWIVQADIHSPAIGSGTYLKYVKPARFAM